MTIIAVTLPLSLAYAGLTALALAMKRHHEAAIGAKPPATRLRAFRAATLRNNLLANGLAAHRSRDTILFVSRTGSRRVAINEASIMSRLRAEAAGVQRVVLELLPFVRRELMRSREPVLKKGAALRGRPCQGRLPVWPRDAAPVHRAPQDRAPAHR